MTAGAPSVGIRSSAEGYVRTVSWAGARRGERVSGSYAAFSGWYVLVLDACAWPIAMAPPLTLTTTAPMSRSRMGWMATEAKTLLISNRSTLAGTATQDTALSHDHAAEK